MTRIWLTTGPVFCLLLSFPASIHADSTPRTGEVPSKPSFLNDVVPILTRFGCNQGACHGKGAGQNGFRLSLRGYAPDWDHSWLTREYEGRRVVFTAPEESLLLRKPAGLAAHEGGKLFDVNSRAYRVLFNWIQTGAPGPFPEEHRVNQLRIESKNGPFHPGDELQLKVIAQFSDGQNQDVTWVSKFDSNDPGIVSVNASGVARVERHGETAVRVSYQGQVAAVILSAPFEHKVDVSRYAVDRGVIDTPVFTKLKSLQIEPSNLADDATFLRRAYLDTLGIPPTPSEVRDFLADRRTDKRSRWIDQVLERPEFVDHWALFLSDLLQNRKERDHDVRGVKGVRSFHEWIREQIKTDQGWDKIARAVLTARGSVTENPPVGYFIVTVGEHREVENSEITASVAQSFLGTRIGCAQCHNHPLEKYTQDDYYHFAAFFSRVHLQRKEPRDGITTLQVADREGKSSKAPIGVHQPRTGQFLKPQPLDRTTPGIASDQDPRLTLANWITSPNNQAFSGAMVNRIWKHFLGVGLVEPVDDLRATNPPSNPELWQALNQEFVSHHFDLKHMIRIILNSRTYQLSSATLPGNESDGRFYSHYYARRLPAEVLLDTISLVTRVPDSFPGYPAGIRAGQLPDPTLKSYFLSLFGRSERVTACACERNGDVTMPQLLHLQNGQSVINKIRSNEGRLGQLLQGKSSSNERLEELFLATLGHFPSDELRHRLAQVLQEAGPDGTADAFRDLFWALLNSKEFSFNH